MTNAATHLATSVLNPTTGVYERIELEPVDGDVDLSSAELSAADLGCEPGTEHRVDLLDADGQILDSIEVTAR